MSCEGIADVFAQDAKEASKIYGMYLLHPGSLKSYADKGNACRISVRWSSGEARFDAWRTKQTIEEGIEGTVVVVECCYIKKVQ